jgi:hypothetical protein
MSDNDLQVPASPRASSFAPSLHVAELWRYPVKSLLGERLPTLDLVGDGVEGDRTWGIQDRSDGRILTARREPRLLFASSRVAAHGIPVITLPNGQEVAGPGSATDAALSAWLGKAVTLVAAAAIEAARAEYFADATDDMSRAIEWTMPKGRFVDAFPVLIMTTTGLLRECLNKSLASRRGGYIMSRRFPLPRLNRNFEVYSPVPCHFFLISRTADPMTLSSPVGVCAPSTGSTVRTT